MQLKTNTNGSAFTFGPRAMRCATLTFNADGLGPHAYLTRYQTSYPDRAYVG